MLCCMAGWNQFDLDFYVSAPKTSSIDSSHHKMTVFDNRLVPGDTADFPAVGFDSIMLSSQSSNDTAQCHTAPSTCCIRCCNSTSILSMHNQWVLMSLL